MVIINDKYKAEPNIHELELKEYAAKLDAESKAKFKAEIKKSVLIMVMFLIGQITGVIILKLLGI